MARLVRLLSPGMDQMLHEGWVQALVHERAERVANTARSIAPVESGAYRASIHVEDVSHPSRVVSQVVADVDYAMEIESNTGNLARALGSA